MSRRIEYGCPHCGWRYAGSSDGLVPIHKWEPEPGKSTRCPGSEQSPRNPESDRRPLWKDLTPEKEEAMRFAGPASAHQAKCPACRDGHDWRPSGMFLMAQNEGLGALLGNGTHLGSQVDRCQRCGLLRIPPQPVRVSRELVPAGEKAGGA